MEKHPKNAKARSSHLPIYPSNPHPDNGKRLFLANNEQFSKNSYVKLQSRRSIQAALLRQWRRGRNVKLTDDSMRELIRHMNFKSPWPEHVHVHQPIHQPVHHPGPQPAHGPKSVRHPPVRKVKRAPPQLAHKPLQQHTEENLTRVLVEGHHPLPKSGSNHKAQPIPARPSNRVPVQWVGPHNRPAQVYSVREQTPLLGPSHNPVVHHASRETEGGLFNFITILIITVLLVGCLYRYFQTP
jgi:hypothetical protein